MIRSKFDDLRRLKALNEKRDLSLRAVSRETGLSFNTLDRLRRQEGIERIYISTLDTLCQYFGVQEIGELIEYVPEEKKEG